MSLIEAIIFGVVEGFTEFLPISSTGHLILLSHGLGIEQSDGHKSFQVIIQLGAILAVVVSFFDILIRPHTIVKLAIAFVPTGLAGLLLYDYIKALFNAQSVAYMLIIGGVLFILIDMLIKEKKSHNDQNSAIDHISYKQAFIIGCFQALSMIPGTSRSGATIIGGIIVGLDRIKAAHFSFLLAVPTMIIAAGYDAYKNYAYFTIDGGLYPLIVGFLVSFVVAMMAIKLFLTIIKRFGFTPFGIYRIILGGVFLYI